MEQGTCTRVLQECLAELLRLEDARYLSVARVEWGAVVSLLGGAISVAVG